MFSISPLITKLSSILRRGGWLASMGIGQGIISLNPRKTHAVHLNTGVILLRKVVCRDFILECFLLRRSRKTFLEKERERKSSKSFPFLFLLGRPKGDRRTKVDSENWSRNSHLK
jgi:hypothetical protein